MKKTYYFFLFLILTVFSSCDIINPEEDIPAYLQIEEFQFSRGAFPGSGNAKIPLAFVYINGEVLGIYELPITIPVIANGQTNIIIDPGIEANGISASPESYPFYERFEITLELKPGETTTIQPTTTYADFADAIGYENFEGNFNSFSFEIDGNDEPELRNSAIDVFSGLTSGYIQLTDSNNVISVGSDLIQDFPPQGSPVYLEVNYKSDLPVAIGIIPFSDNGLVVRVGEDQNKGFNPKGEWNKIYFDFSDTFLALRNLPEVTSFRISITTLIPSDYEDDVAEVFLDEIQLVWRK